MPDQRDSYGVSAARLLPCPFCGAMPTSKWASPNVPGMEDCGYWGIDCGGCESAHVHADSEEEAIAAWNRRAAGGWEEFLAILDEFLTHYPPDSIVCSDLPHADSGARFTAALRRAREVLNA